MQIEQLWTELSALSQSPVYRRVDDTHPFDLYAGIEASGEHALMLVTKAEPPVPPKYQAVQILRNRRHDDRWVLLFRLRLPEFAPLFSRLCQDLIDASRTAQAGTEPAAFLLTRLARWRRLMELAPSALLSDSELRGLLGELVFMAQFALPGWGIPIAVNGWVGPSGAPQDFSAPGLNVEVKACRPGIPKVSISSVDQLESMDPILLAVACLASADADIAGAFTPRSLVTQLRETMRNEEAALSQFDLSLSAAGYEDREEYSQMHFRLESMRFFNVREGFPRIRHSMVPAGITSVAYDIGLEACKQFECGFPGVAHGA